MSRSKTEGTAGSGEGGGCRPEKRRRQQTTGRRVTTNGLTKTAKMLGIVPLAGVMPRLRSAGQGEPSLTTVPSP
jgi:hypothetical protein